MKPVHLDISQYFIDINNLVSLLLCVYCFFILDKIELMGLCTVGTHNSTCPVPCEETDYPITISYSTFASEQALKFLSAKLKKNTEYARYFSFYHIVKP